MPFTRPTLSDLRNQVAQDIAAAAPGTDALLRFGNLKTTGNAQAGLAHLHYGYLDWIALQSNPFTATDEFLEAWAGLVGIIRKSATSAAGIVQFTGAPGVDIPVGTALARGDGVAFITTTDGVVNGAGVASVAAVAVADPTGLTGAFGNCPAGTVMNIGAAISGAQSSGAVTTAFIGGADLETDDSLRSRMLARYQAPPQGGCQNDYLGWALAVPGVTRAWVAPNGFGAGTVVVYVMLDVSEAAYGGFPQGSNGVATADTRGTAATGDQLTVANAILPVQPVTALVYACAPIANPVNFTISGLSGASAATKAAIAAAITGAFILYGAPGGTVDLSVIETAIALITGTAPFVITSPTANIASAAGALPTLGTVTYI
ncbi:MAG TPA: baseplate J/gp47 family protein [Patescibacteria group bacterium]|nr:baseplate J/gp47 family protein [Patescibacteria group bacterium]